MVIKRTRDGHVPRRENLRDLSGFTLIELLVVIAIIALLMGILMPGLQKARKAGQSAVCKAHLRQWGTTIHLYTSDNDSKFWTEHNVWATNVPYQGNWMLMLAALYGDVDKARLCPSASRLNGPEGGIGTTFQRWGPGPIMVNHRFADDTEKVYGSYGINLWINSVEPPSVMGWRSQPERHWKTMTAARHPAIIPMVADCTWFGTNPVTLNDGQSPNGGKPTPTRDWWETKDPISFGDWSWDMARVCLNRHGRGVNMVLMDGSARKIFLPELWSLKWHKEFKLIDEVEIPWMN